MNNVTLSGRLTKEPDVRYGGENNSVAIARFTLAVDDYKSTDFINIRALGKTAEWVEKWLQKGNKVELVGKIKTGHYTGKIFLPEYQTALTNDIIHTAKEIFTKAWTANNIRVGDEPRNWLERKKLQQEAARECNNLLAFIQMAKPLYHLTSKRVKYWGQKTIEVRQALRDWNAGDTKRYGKLE